MLKRRSFLKHTLAAGAGLVLWPWNSGLADSKITHNTIPSTEKNIPVIGMGTWITFNVGDDKKARQQRTQVLREFFNQGGGLIDSSPMYGSSQEVLGFALSRIQKKPNFFSATKVWTSDSSEGPEQIERAKELWHIDQFDLLQVHNLVAWQEHLEMLFEMKRQGQLGYVGVTTSHGRRHDELEQIMETKPIDFVQLTYNIRRREAEKRLLPLAREKNIAVIANRPYQGGSLIKGLQQRNKPLPKWAGNIGCKNWADFLLKFIVSHPAVTCAIPATTKVEHMKENMQAGHGPFPDKKTRKKMIEYMASL